MNKKMINLVDVSKTYKVGNESIKALQDITLNVEKGEFLAIVGPSGSGKSTLLHLIGGLDTPSSGSIIVNNNNIEQLKDKKLSAYRNNEIGLIFQDFKLHPYLTILENVELPQHFNKTKKLTANTLKRKAKQMLKTFDIEKRGNHRPNEISGGQKQRAAMARALINSPSIILADEPTGNLDSLTGKKILQILKKIHKENGTTLIIVTHDKAIADYANRIVEIKDGKLMEKNNFSKFTR